MKTDELIQTLRKLAPVYNPSVKDVLEEAADKLQEQDKIIKQYQKADCFLAAHGWEWEEGGCWYDD